jgi:hypothetical protein
MVEHDPRQAITEYVGLPLGIVQPNPPLHAPAQGQRFQGELRRGGGLGARDGTIRFFQERRLPDRQLHEITFEDEAGQHEHWLCFVVQDQQGGWRMGGGANVSDAKHAPGRDHPWANLAGGGWEDRFWAGGRVLDNGLDVVRVRLISKNGKVLEDLVQDGLVLFITDQKIQVPVQVELYDRAGNLVGTHPCFHR